MSGDRRAVPNAPSLAGRPRSSSSPAIANLFTFEVALVAFLLSGSYSQSPLVSWLPLDLPRSLALVSLASGVYLLLARRVALPRSALAVPALVAALGVWMAVSLTWAPPNPYGVTKTIMLLTTSLWSALAGALIAQYPDRIRRMLWALIAFAAWFSLARLASPEISYVLEPLGSGYLDYAPAIGTGATALFGLVLLEWGSVLGRACGLFCVVPMVLALLQSGARGATLGLAASLPIILVYWSVGVDRSLHAIRVRWQATVLALAVILGLLVLAQAMRSDSSLSRHYRTLDRLQALQETSTIGGRTPLAAMALTMWYDRPWVGHGVGSFPIYFDYGPVRQYPHNALLEALCELGIVGGGALILLVAVPVWRSLRALARSGSANSLRMVVLSLIAYTLFQALKSLDLPLHNILYAMLGVAASWPRCSVTTERTHDREPPLQTRARPK